MNKGKIAADEQTDKLTELMTGSKRLSVCIDGPRASVAEALKGISGVIKVEAGRDISTTNGITFKIESEGGRDVRADVFRLCAEMNTPILGMETVSASLEDVFMSITRENRGKKVKAK
jgi:ABC-2 type transport system ATP-binding protein